MRNQRLAPRSQQPDRPERGPASDSAHGKDVAGSSRLDAGAIRSLGAGFRANTGNPRRGYCPDGSRRTPPRRVGAIDPGLVGSPAERFSGDLATDASLSLRWLETSRSDRARPGGPALGNGLLPSIRRALLTNADSPGKTSLVDRRESFQDNYHGPKSGLLMNMWDAQNLI